MCTLTDSKIKQFQYSAYPCCKCNQLLYNRVFKTQKTQDKVLRETHLSRLKRMCIRVDSNTTQSIVHANLHDYYCSGGSLGVSGVSGNHSKLALKV